jgi:hypothetical protein
MLGGINITALFGSVAGRNELLNKGHLKGVKVSGVTSPPNGDHTIINFGSLDKTDIISLSTAPLGYEGEEYGGDGDSSNWVIERDVYVSLNFGKDTELDNIFLEEVQFLPHLKTGPTFRLLTEDGKSPTGTDILAGTRSKFTVQIDVGREDFTGYLGKWMVMCCIGFSKQHGDISSSPFIMMVKLTGCVVANAALSTKSSLSVESRPFVPRSATAYFDAMVPIFEMPQNPLLPKSFEQADDVGRFTMPLPERLRTEYTAVIDKRTLPEFIEAHPILVPLAPLPNTHSEAATHLSRLSLLAAFEECHMSISIKSYDIPRTKINFFFNVYHDVSDTVQCALIVKGSQENRPKILIGDTIRIRSLGDALIVGERKNMVVPVPCIEMQGVVRSFRLATEEVICEFPVPPGSVFFRAKKFKKLCADDVLKALDFQVRFTCDRRAFGFIQESIQTMRDIRNSPILKMIFPCDAVLPQSEVFSCALSAAPALEASPVTALLNDQQLNVVKHLAAQAAAMGKDAPAWPWPAATTKLPFVIFGPPGTGQH